MYETLKNEQYKESSVYEMVGDAKGYGVDVDEELRSKIDFKADVERSFAVAHESSKLTYIKHSKPRVQTLDGKEIRFVDLVVKGSSKEEVEKRYESLIESSKD